MSCEMYGDFIGMREFPKIGDPNIVHLYSIGSL